LRNSEPNRFCRYELRTTDVDAARSFYADLLGPDIWGAVVDVQPLPAQAARRGAPPHWLGHIGVDDVVGSALRLIEAGATQPGRLPNESIDSSRAILRDPFGAMVALMPARVVPEGDRVSWHLLHTRDESFAFRLYGGLFGWTPLELVDARSPGGRLQIFSWDGLGRVTGATTNAASLPHVHPQWLFFFRTGNLRTSLAKVREWGGLTLPPTSTPDGELIVPCDDPQGAAFGLSEKSRR
jgi:YD repeat-containing protein